MRNRINRIIQALEYAVLSISVAVSIYLIAYCALLRPGPIILIAVSGSLETGVEFYERIPSYRGLPAWVFRPVEIVDRRYVRPSFWNQTRKYSSGFSLVRQRLPNQTNAATASNAPSRTR